MKVWWFRLNTTPYHLPEGWDMGTEVSFKAKTYRAAWRKAQGQLAAYGFPWRRPEAIYERNS